MQVCCIMTGVQCYARGINVAPNRSNAPGNALRRDLLCHPHTKSRRTRSIWPKDPTIPCYLKMIRKPESLQHPRHQASPGLVPKIRSHRFECLPDLKDSAKSKLGTAGTALSELPKKALGQSLKSLREAQAPTRTSLNRDPAPHLL